VTISSRQEVSSSKIQLIGTDLKMPRLSYTHPIDFKTVTLDPNKIKAPRDMTTLERATKARILTHIPNPPLLYRLTKALSPGAQDTPETKPELIPPKLHVTRNRPS
jgi:hypothetical protein